MYLPKSKYRILNKVDGKLIDPETKEEYTGTFIKDYKKRYYKGSIPKRTPESLEFIPNNAPISISEFVFKNDYVEPTEKDYKRKFYLRYFIQDTRDRKIVEVKVDSFIQAIRNPVLYRKPLRIEWELSQPLEDTIFKGFKYEGSRTKNIKTTERAEEILPGITEQHLSDPAQFVK